MSGLSFSPEGRRLAAAHVDGLSIFSAENGAREHRLEWKGSHIGVSWSPDGRYVVSATQERELHVWDLVTLGDLRLGGYPHKIHGMNWLTPRTVPRSAPAPMSLPPGRLPTAVRAASRRSRSATSIMGWSARWPPIRNAHWWPAAIRPAACCIGGIVKGEALLARASQGDAITAVAWSSDGTRLIAGTDGGNAIVVDIPEELSIQ